MPKRIGAGHNIYFYIFGFIAGLFIDMIIKEISVNYSTV